jgi:hypothetical protein
VPGLHAELGAQPVVDGTKARALHRVFVGRGIDLRDLAFFVAVQGCSERGFGREGGERPGEVHDDPARSCHRRPRAGRESCRAGRVGSGHVLDTWPEGKRGRCTLGWRGECERRKNDRGRAR